MSLNTAAATEWILSLDLGAQGPLSFKSLGSGKSNLAFAVSDATGRRWVLRRPPAGKLLSSAHDIQREHRILLGLAGTPVPSPRPLGLRKPVPGDEVTLLLMEYAEGLALDSIEKAETLNPTQRRRVGLDLAKTLAKVHAVDLDGTDLANLSARGPYAGRQLRRWRLQWENSKCREAPMIEDLADRLEAAQPVGSELTLVHGDCHYLNLIIAPETGNLVSLLDWELATLGDPLADVGTLLAFSRPPGPPPEVPIRPIAVALLPGFPDGEELAGAYFGASGRDDAALPFWVTLAYWKLAIIIEGVRRRAFDRPGAPTYPAAAVDCIVQLATATAVRAGI